MQKYDPKALEPKWQKEWEKEGVFNAEDSSSKPKYYALIEFPYPSGDGLHVGHPRPYLGMDIIARKRRMEGFNVLYPIGWDAFGLPTENYAIKTGMHPREVTKTNSDNFRRQIKMLGISFDWSREINTTDPAYFKWTQWLFLQFLKHGLAYKAKTTINWCPKDKIGLANEEAAGGVCDRCGGPVEKREKEQWMLKITAYAEKLLEGLKTVDYIERAKVQQSNWIGKSEGAEISFALSFKKNPTDNDRRGPNGEKAAIPVFTTRPDTLFGATYLVLAPEHAWVTLAMDDEHDVLTNKDEVKAYIDGVKNRTEIDRTAEGKEKTGVELKGVKAINPTTNEEIPMFIADYVLPQYGTGAIMAVPAHDERDWEFAKKYNLPIREVVVPNIVDHRNPPVADKKIVERNNIHAIVRDPKTDKYLALKWREYDWTTFPMGGVEEGEDAVTAARREVREETGFTRLKLMSVLPGRVRAEYFAKHKDENRVAITTAVLFELEGHEKDAVAQKESSLHEIIWLDEKDLNYEVMTHAEVGFWGEQMKSPHAFVGDGFAVDSGFLNGLPTWKAREDMTSWLEEKGFGKKQTTYKLRDWVFSRQRYWGEPIPVVHCGACGIVPLSEDQLPLELPGVERYEPTDNGESPLAAIESWVNTTCPKCKGAAKRETDVMPNWAGSSWYFLRYVDPKNNKAFAGADALKHWMPVDWYNGGMEHTTLHLLYSRFWNLFLHDIGLVPVSEPYKKRTSHGLIMAEDGEKMSKSRGNVINPDEIVARFGADSVRVYEMFIGPFDQSVPWSTDGLVGVYRFLERVWSVRMNKVSSEKADKTHEITRLLHKTIKKVSEDIETMRFNTAVSAMMILVNKMSALDAVPQSLFEKFLVILSPFAPHIAEELWSTLGKTTLIAREKWPAYDAELIVDDTVVIPVQVNGKLRDTLTLDAGASKETIEKAALALEKVQKYVVGKEIIRVVVVPDKLCNIVVKE